MKVGQPCTFYHEGGKGERKWVVGWRYGIVRSIPARGKQKGWVQVEISVARCLWDEATKSYQPRPNERAWVHGGCVNEVGDYIYHGGAALVREVEERKEAKIKDQAKANKRMKKPAPK